LGSALGLMAEAFRNPGSELAGWCNNILDLPPRRLARHLDALADALFPPGEAEQPRPGAAYGPESSTHCWCAISIARASLA
jgi:hypothetical protein